MNNSAEIQALSEPVKSTSSKTMPSSQLAPYPDQSSPLLSVSIVPSHMKSVGLLELADAAAPLFPVPVTPVL